MRRQYAILLVPLIVVIVGLSIAVWIGPYKYENIMKDGPEYSAEGGETGRIVRFSARSYDRRIEFNVFAIEGKFDFFVLTLKNYLRKRDDLSYTALYERLDSIEVNDVVTVGDEREIYVGFRGHDCNLTISGRIVAKCWAYSFDVDGWWERVDTLHIPIAPTLKKSQRTNRLVTLITSY